jgi:hypothetical protein
VGIGRNLSCLKPPKAPNVILVGYYIRTYVLYSTRSDIESDMEQAIQPISPSDTEGKNLATLDGIALSFPTGIKLTA